MKLCAAGARISHFEKFPVGNDRTEKTGKTTSVVPFAWAWAWAWALSGAFGRMTEKKVKDARARALNQKAPQVENNTRQNPARHEAHRLPWTPSVAVKDILISHIAALIRSTCTLPQRTD